MDKYQDFRIVSVYQDRPVGLEAGGDNLGSIHGRLVVHDDVDGDRREEDSVPDYWEVPPQRHRRDDREAHVDAV